MVTLTVMCVPIMSSQISTGHQVDILLQKVRLPYTNVSAFVLFVCFDHSDVEIFPFYVCGISWIRQMFRGGGATMFGETIDYR